MKPATCRSYLDINLALRDSLQDPDWMFKVGVGGVLNAACLVSALSSPLMLPVVFVLVALTSGYILRVIRNKATNFEGKLPNWGGWAELLISGVTWIVVQLAIWLFVLLLGFSAIVFGLLVAYAQPSYAVSTICIVITAATVLLAWLLVSFIVTFLMVNFAVEESIASGFAVRKVLYTVSRDPVTFIVTWLLCLGLQGIAIVVPTLTLAGVFLTPSTLFAAQVISANLLSQVFKTQNS